MIRNILNLTKNSKHFRITNRFDYYSSLNIEKLEEDTVSLDVIDDEAKLKEQELEKKRNKSRLSPIHYNIIHGKPPYEEPKHSSHVTLKYKRRMFGKYGYESGVSVQLCWPTKAELTDSMEFEKVSNPRTIPEMIESAKKLREEKEARVQQRQEDISNKMLKLNTWIHDVNQKIAKKEGEAHAAKERREKLIEEVRRHFGYTVDPRDERFKEMLEKKEKEQKKIMKDARKKAKEEKIISRILSKKGDTGKSENKNVKQ